MRGRAEMRCSPPPSIARLGREVQPVLPLVINHRQVGSGKVIPSPLVLGSPNPMGRGRLRVPGWSVERSWQGKGGVEGGWRGKRDARDARTEREVATSEAKVESSLPARR